MNGAGGPGSGGLVQSPLNFTGGKYRLLPQILPLFPESIGTFVDLFCGGCNVGVNVSAVRHWYNDADVPLIGLYRAMTALGPDRFEMAVEDVIQEYGLSDVKTHGYDHYGCESSAGLAQVNRAPYLRLRADVNAMGARDTAYYVRLYVLIVFAFNNQIRFNSRGEFNLPVGKRDFNQKMAGKLRAFIAILQRQDARFTAGGFADLDFAGMGADDLVYADPPYLITCASYNEAGGWTEGDERQLLALLDTLSARGVRFALSNVLESKGGVNAILGGWLEERGYHVHDLDYSYRNSNYHRKGRDAPTKEILVTNF